MKTRRLAGPLSIAVSLALCAAVFAPARAGEDSAESAKAQSGIPFGESISVRANRHAVSALAQARRAHAALKSTTALSAARVAGVKKTSPDVPFGNDDDQIQDKQGYFNACGHDIAAEFKSGAKEGAVAVGALGLIVGAVVGSGAGPLGTIGGGAAGAAAGGLLGGLVVGAAGAVGSALICANDYVHTR